MLAEPTLFPWVSPVHHMFEFALKLLKASTYLENDMPYICTS